jgi:hypothetical protein
LHPAAKIVNLYILLCMPVCEMRGMIVWWGVYIGGLIWRWESLKIWGLIWRWEGN